MFTGISVSCGVKKGRFVSERFVRIETVDRGYWECAVDKEIIFGLENEPQDEEYVSGRIYAYLISFDEETAMIELPVEESATGRRILVSRSLVRKEKIPA